MSRFTKIKGDLEISFGFDEMMPRSGYFFQVFKFSHDTKTDGTKEETIVNEGMVVGISKSKMLNLMVQYQVGTKEQLQNIALDLKI